MRHTATHPLEFFGALGAAAIVADRAAHGVCRPCINNSPRIRVMDTSGLCQSARWVTPSNVIQSTVTEGTRQIGLNGVSIGFHGVSCSNNAPVIPTVTPSGRLRAPSDQIDLTDRLASCTTAMSAARTTDRQKSFKKGIDADFTRRRREDTTIQIRKTIKEDRLNQRRRMIVLVRTWKMAWSWSSRGYEEIVVVTTVERALAGRGRDNGRAWL